MENEETFDKFAEENRALAKRFQDLFDAESKGETSDAEILHYRDYTDPHREAVNIERLPEDYEEWPSTVSGLKLPAFMIQHFDYSEGNASGRQVRTPQGALPVSFFVADGNFYYVSEDYLLNESGQAMKITEIEQHDLLDEDKREIEEGIVSYPQLDFTPTEGDSMMALDPGDYERITYILDKIQSGGFILRTDV